jgi:hypothetical protein
VSAQLVGLQRISPTAPLSYVSAAKEHFSGLGQLTRQLLPEEDASRVFTTYASSIQMIEPAGISTYTTVNSTYSTGSSTGNSTYSTDSAAITFKLNPSPSSSPGSLTPSFKAIFCSQEYLILFKAISSKGTLSCHCQPLQLLSGLNLESLRSLQLASKFTSQLHRSQKPLATLAVYPTICLTGSQVTVRLSQIEEPLIVEIYLECSEELVPKKEEAEETVRVCQLVKKYPIATTTATTAANPIYLDYWEQIIPLAPTWESSVETALIRVEWRLRMKLMVAGQVGEFEVIIPITLYKNKFICF